LAGRARVLSIYLLGLEALLLLRPRAGPCLKLTGTLVKVGQPSVLWVVDKVAIQPQPAAGQLDVVVSGSDRAIAEKAALGIYVRTA